MIAITAAVIIIVTITISIVNANATTTPTTSSNMKGHSMNLKLTASREDTWTSRPIRLILGSQPNGKPLNQEIHFIDSQASDTRGDP